MFLVKKLRLSFYVSCRGDSHLGSLAASSPQFGIEFVLDNLVQDPSELFEFLDRKGFQKG